MRNIRTYWVPETPVLDLWIIGTLLDPSLLTNLGNLVENKHESTSYPTDTTVDNYAQRRTRRPFTVVPVSQKTKRADYAQDQTKRPFTVYEVEALVHAVEELGTGRRWCDAKLRSFENADHRTNVDLMERSIFRSIMIVMACRCNHG
ncbi:telomere repeat-binding protein 4-like [Lotus japonicus]|uniref:telomere repeat-binding protein 4-like n=1 Tax=Lotus japonicus TaxID=34305 RepID=UPI002585187A|nr:telomere repeat-binding protein 4-like [Lotus japonicus]